ncbi:MULTISPECIES: peptide deformylase [Alteromonadaceae]|uniref:peptide deformylase n=1 Tax=Alteromonadaceae TaxID=72275 RepID=UPI001C089083|nr:MULTISPECIES: peptide deformylase [Aliiglaciecola]MBU2877323.1 peptide deformylase [Aliiglaciecola lipolytica]MDO6711977.1 peptide deformylase [Aliiglaciecola sp. 2_MG-2023]MDO6753659.1 peptide deformylase [Aliiglaciecola sp. 1_MG-2023]
MKIAQVGETILKTPAVAVSPADLLTNELTQFLLALKQTMLDANGIGIAAPQVFDPRAIMIIASRPNARYPDAPHMEPLILINPKVLASSETQNKDWEGCLSVPGLRGNVKRFTWIEIEYLAENGDIEKRLFEGFLARIFQHEYDHLIGKTWLDHIESADDVMANEVWQNKYA